MENKYRKQPVNSKKYSRQEKIEHYNFKLFQAKNRVQFYEAKLKYLLSDEYQDWDSELEKQLDTIKNKKGD